MTDFNLKITVRNGRLLRAIREKYGSPAEMCRALGMHQSSISALITMRVKPFREDGSLTVAAEEIVSALGMEPDQLWPEHIARLRARKASVEVEMDAETFAAIASDDPEKTAIYRQAISRWSRDLTDRDRRALAAHIAGAALEDIGGALGGVTRERARQVIVRAQRKIRKRAMHDGVRSFEDIAS